MNIYNYREGWSRQWIILYLLFILYLRPYITGYCDSMKNFISVLKPDASSTGDEVKKRYRELVKQNHPDLFPEDKRREQNLILMEINEAYLCIIGNNFTARIQDSGTAGSSENLPVKHKDPAYVYYKSAIEHLNTGNYIFNWSRYATTKFSYHFDVRKSSLLKTAREALEHYMTAYNSFMKVCTSYPGSVWVRDSADKLDQIEKMNERYTEIIERLTGGLTE